MTTQTNTSRMPSGIVFILASFLMVAGFILTPITAEAGLRFTKIGTIDPALVGDPTIIEAGDVINYKYEVTNNDPLGGVTQTNVTITDASVGPITCPNKTSFDNAFTNGADDLIPGERVDCFGAHIITAPELALDDDKFENTASVTSTQIPGGVSSTAITYFLELFKSGSLVDNIIAGPLAITSIDTGTDIITVNAHGLTNGQFISISGSDAELTGGVPLDGNSWQVTVLDADTFQIFGVDIVNSPGALGTISYTNGVIDDGDDIVYTYRITNYSPHTMTNVSLEDVTVIGTPANLGSISCRDSGGNPIGAPGAVGTIQTNVLGSLSAGDFIICDSTYDISPTDIPPVGPPTVVKNVLNVGQVISTETGDPIPAPGVNWPPAIPELSFIDPSDNRINIHVEFMNALPPLVGDPLNPLTNNCTEDVYNFHGQSQKLQCTANDVVVASIRDLFVLDDGCAFAGDTVTFRADFEVELNSNSARTDIGLFISQDGTDALRGTCTASSLAFAPDPPFLDDDGTSNDPGGVIQDVCGDLNDIGPNEGGHSTPFPHDHLRAFVENLTVTVLCIDPDDDGFLNVPHCTTWTQPGDDRLCTSVDLTYPGSPAKCNCNSDLTIPIQVPPSKLTVIKTVVNDIGETFGLEINSAVGIESGVVGNGGSIFQESNTLTGTTATVRETFTGTALDGDYDTTINCFLTSELGGAETPLSGGANSAFPVIDNDGDAGPVTVEFPGTGADYTCRITNTFLGTPSILLDKTGSLDTTVVGDPAIAEPGDVINYTFTVTNNGDVTLTDVAVTDPLVPVITCPSGTPIPSLAPGASEVCTGSYAIAQADIDAGVKNNVATATGQCIVSGCPVSDDDPHSETIPNTPLININKEGLLDLGANGIADPGDIINY
ncbi:MAG: DUF11 domain-containing protein, partial [Nitrospinota bacterium]|nr:DUF11 domain-containing protein [Nitrospinota bacterium]